MTALGKAFKEVPHDRDDHCGLWKLYRSTDETTEATLGGTLEAGKLEALSVQVRFLHYKWARVASCGAGWNK